MDRLPFAKEKPFRDAKARAFYKRTHGKCEGCGKRRADDVHHLRSRARGGGDEENNLLALCRHPCHSSWANVNQTRREWLAAREATMTEETIAKVRHALRFLEEA